MRPPPAYGGGTSALCLVYQYTKHTTHCELVASAFGCPSAPPARPVAALRSHSSTLMLLRLF